MCIYIHTHTHVLHVKYMYMYTYTHTKKAAKTIWIATFGGPIQPVRGVYGVFASCLLAGWLLSLFFWQRNTNFGPFLHTTNRSWRSEGNETPTEQNLWRDAPHVWNMFPRMISVAYHLCRSISFLVTWFLQNGRTNAGQATAPQNVRFLRNESLKWLFSRETNG